MFCKQCGTSMNDDVKFCPNCGTPSDAAAPQQQQQPAAAPQQQQQPAAAPQQQQQQPAAVPSEFSKNAGSYVRGVWDLVKPFFSAAPTKAVATAAKNRAHSWIAIGVIGALINAFATMILISSTIGKIDKFLGIMNTNIISYGLVFGLSLLYGLLFFGLTAGALALLMLISGKKVAFASVANVVSVASMPVICALTINMLAAVVYPMATVLLLTTSLMMAVVLLYVGLQQLDRFEKSPFWIFSGMLFVLVIINVSIFGSFIKTIVESIFYAFGSGLGDLFGSGLSGLFF